MRIGAIVQARTSSSRLPGKVLKELPYESGITVLTQVIRRLKDAKRLNEIIVATTINAEDNDIVKISGAEHVKIYRGAEDDVLSRYYFAARENVLDIIVRITSDCPCIDPQIVDAIIEKHIQGNTDYSSNTLKRTYPRGLDVEVFKFDVLEKTFLEATEDFEKEHVTSYMYRSGKFKLQNIEAPDGFNRPDIRITLDTKEDYGLLCAVYDFLSPQGPVFGAKAIIDLFEMKPWLFYLNEKVEQKKVFYTLEDELQEALRILDTQGLMRIKSFLKKKPII